VKEEGDEGCGRIQNHRDYGKDNSDQEEVRGVVVGVHKIHHHNTRMEVVEEEEETEVVGVQKIHDHSSLMKEVKEAYGNAMRHVGQSRNLEDALRTWNLFVGCWTAVGPTSLSDEALTDEMG
jgi:hypothetical protein